MFLRKCSLREIYAPLESESVLAQVDVPRLLKRRNVCNHRIVSRALILSIQDFLAFQHIDRSPTTQGEFEPPSFIAVRRSDKLALLARVSSHRVLVLYQLLVSSAQAQILTLSPGLAAFLHTKDELLEETCTYAVAVTCWTCCGRATVQLPFANRGRPED